MSLAVAPEELQRQAIRIAERIAPMIVAEMLIAPQLAPPSTPFPAPRSVRDQRLIDLCKQVGAAVDELQQVKFTPQEPHARNRLEQAARRLKKELDSASR